MRSSKSKMLIAGTIVLGLLTALLVYGYLMQVRAAAVVEDLTTVVTASRKIPQGTKLSSDMLRAVEMPAGYAHPFAVKDPKSIVGQFAIVDIWPEETILTAQLASEKTANELPYKIPEETRAITIAVNQVSGVAGHIKPGHYVDVLLFYKEGDQPENTKAITLLNNILVLAVGHDMQKKDGVQDSDNLTLAVTPRDAQLVTLAENIGRIKLVLRPSGEDARASLPPATLRSLRTLYP